jgi:Fic-DOC domain mobile mystery protein B
VTGQRLSLAYPPGATPLDPNEVDGLIPTYVTLQRELNEVEQRNILEARAWAIGRRHKSLLSDAFIQELHRRMFGDVWRWAGEYRQSDKSIGVPKEYVREEVQKLIRDVEYWIANETYPWVELGVRFHHRLVVVHPFANGNGRHARFMTDLLLEAHHQPEFRWGASLSSGLDGAGPARSQYIEALREADGKKYEALIAFVRK